MAADAFSPADATVPAPALELLVERGFDATSVDELAAAVGVSRSTFFRRYGSKEDMVFADHDERLRVATASLAASELALGPAASSRERAEALVPAALAVFDHHVTHERVSLLRRELLHRVPSLRDRELVSTHRFERLFREFLLRAGAAAPTPGDPATTWPTDEVLAARRDIHTDAVALAAAVVAVHNDVLREWLRRPGPEVRARLEAALFRVVGARPAAATTDSSVISGPTVVIVTAATSSPRDVADAVERSLRERA